MRTLRFLHLLLVLGLPLAAETPRKVDFVREVRPLLSDRCFACHGPDEQNRRANLRLDDASSIVAYKDKILKRITHEKKGLRMPPPGSIELTAPQIETLRAWIAQGAEYRSHWAYTPPVRPSLPAVKDTAWTRNEIDRFVLARLEREGLTPSPRASKAQLLRRVTFDLTGLPPTVAELEAFLADSSPRAYEKVVDRLLASPHYGERMAMPWLDLARYADTHGFHIDSKRDMWAWRDWVINAFSRNLPFDQFTIWQLAGDLLPNPTREQLIATGFNRNHMINYEGGAIPEEYQTEYVIDRVETTSTVFMGMTMGCARCHDHKYDPIRQKEFYRFFAFFNTVNEKGLDGQLGNARPELPLPSDEQLSKQQRVEARIADLESWLDSVDTADLLAGWALGAKIPAAPESSGTGAAASVRLKVSSRLESLPAVVSLTPWTLWLDGGQPVGRNRRGSHIYLARDGKVQRSREWLITGDWMHLVVNGGDLLVNGRGIELEPSSEAVPAVNSRGTRDGLRLFSRPLNEAEIRALGVEQPVRDILAVERSKQSAEQKQILLSYFLENAAPANLRDGWQELKALYRERDDLRWEIPTTMVMSEMAVPRSTKVLARGDYRNGTEEVTPGVPSFLPPLPPGEKASRLTLARWLVSKDHPLTARVAVNRFWQMYFGTGLVKTVEDFGSQGELPSHPELLDWLATEFMASGWDVKAMQRRIVLSATYQQSSRVTPSLIEKDPENRLLARGPRFRLPAEVVRDNALAVSGLLNPQIGGPSVAPYQPAGLWDDIAYGDVFSAQIYEQGRGADLYRRSMYTFWKRTSPPPSLSTFDAPDREKCTARRAVTNTPLQALVLLNDPTYVEAARVLAARALASPRPLEYLFATVLSRRPSAREMAVLKAQAEQQLGIFRNNADQVAKLLSVGEAPSPARIDAPRLAAWTTVASVVLNLDETITKE